ncbi:MAG: hypothetical protein Tsb007_05970 [Rhizobacter sp.]
MGSAGFAAVAATLGITVERAPAPKHAATTHPVITLLLMVITLHPIARIARVQ